MSLQINKSRVAESFSRAAKSYDGSAQLQRDVGNQLLQLCIERSSHLTPLSASGRILDLGCGTGFFSRKLHQSYPSCDLVCLDIAQGMLEHARTVSVPEPYQWLCADAESLPIASGSIDLLFSSLAIQWCENLEQLFLDVSRVLKPGAKAFFSSLGPASLHELRSAWALVDQNVHVNEFTPLQKVLQSLPADLSFEVSQVKLHKLEYDKLQQLTTDLKNIGAHNMNAGEAKGLTGRVKVKQFKQHYETYRQENGKLPASYEVYYISVKKH